MAIAAKTILWKSSEQDFDYFGLFPGREGQCGTPAPGGGKCPTDGHAARAASAAYLMPPSLETVQEMIGRERDTSIPCRILSALHSLFPLNRFLLGQNDPVAVLSVVFQKWLESFIPETVIEKFDLSLQILPDHEVDCDLFDCTDEGGRVIQFGINDFFDNFFPIGDLLQQYDKTHPGLAKFILQMLSACPLNFGTPENIYEMTSYYCWNDEEDEKAIFEERCAEYRDECENEDEDDAQEYARAAIPVDCAEFEERFPDWTFKRDERQSDYRGKIPPELQKMKFHYDRYRRQKNTNHLFPFTCYPAIIVPLDRDTYDFSCEVINRIGNEQCQCGGSYCFSTLAWRFQPEDRRMTQKALREIRIVLEYFGACSEFLLSCEKEYQDA